MLAESVGEINCADELILVVQGLSDNLEQIVRAMFYELGITVSNKILIDRGFGIGRSRNISFQNSSSTYVWTIDDDVVLIRNAVANIKKSLEENIYPDLLCTMIECKESKRLYKRYPKKKVKVLKPHDSLRISSIEMIINLNFIKGNRMRYSENIGVGTEWCAGEENFFVLNCMNNDARALFTPLRTIKHTCLREDNNNNSWSSLNNLILRGVLIKKVGDIYGIIFLVKYITYAIYFNKSFSLCKYLFKGILEHRRYYKFVTSV